jgi:hypothetical protein
VACFSNYIIHQRLEINLAAFSLNIYIYIYIYTYTQITCIKLIQTLQNEYLKIIIHHLHTFTTSIKYLKYFDVAAVTFQGRKNSYCNTWSWRFLSIYLWLYSPCGTWTLFQFLNLYTVGRTPWTGISQSQGRHLHIE